jgi:hypothetical protein
MVQRHAATTFTVDSDKQITATVPAGTPMGKGLITVDGPHGTSPAKVKFTVTP